MFGLEMSESTSQEFTLVGKRRRKKKLLCGDYDESSPSYIIKLAKKAEAALEQLEGQQFLMAAYLSFETAARRRPRKDPILQIICYGLGSVSNSTSSMFQFSLINYWSRQLNCSLQLYDPAFTAADIKLLESLNCRVLSVNDEGMRKADVPTLFFLPHAPRFVLENILSTNWGLNLSMCVIFGDNLQTIVDNTLTRVLKKNYPSIADSERIVQIVPLDNSFKYSDIFNDLAFHVFETPESSDFKT